MKRLIRLGLLALLLLSFSLVRPVFAGEGSGDQIVFGDNFTLEAGETVDGDLVVLAGNVEVEAGAHVTGNVVVMGGNVNLAGEVGGDVVVFGGNVDLRATALVNGRLETVGGAISREDGALVVGGEGQGFGPGRIDIPNIPDRFGFLRPVVRVGWWSFNAVLTTLLASLLALAVTALWPEQTARVSAAITSAPGASGGLGLLTIVAVPILLALVTVITLLCATPLTFVGLVIFMAALLFGWLAFGLVLGARLAAALKWQNASPALAAGLGTAMVTFAAQLLDLVPCVGWVAPFLLAAVGLGAVTLTRFGTRPYLPGTTPTNPPTLPAPPEAGPASA
jgi:hypothetical protein